ncbi:hypothetical protein COBT_001479 [Conglomerata obtusa]
MIKSIQRAEIGLLAVLFFNDEQKQKKGQRQGLIEHMTKLKLENFKFKIYSRVDKNTESKGIDGLDLANYVYKNFYNWFGKNLENKKTSGNHCALGIEHRFNKNGLFSDVIELFKGGGIRKQIIVDNYCESEMDYQIMHRLLLNITKSTSCQSNFLILCLDNDDDNDRNMMLYEIKQILYAYKNFFTGACYTDIVKNNADYEIKVFKTKDSQDFSETNLVNILPFSAYINVNRISIIWNNSINTKIMFEIIVNEDELYISDEIPKNLFTRGIMDWFIIF